MVKALKVKGSKKKKHNQFIISIGLVFLIAISGVIGFLKFYNSYIDETLYAERLSQMREVTTQLFAGLEDVVGSDWRKATTSCSRLLDKNPKDMDEFLKFMEKEASLEDFESMQLEFIAVDEDGRYYTQTGEQGLLNERNYLSSSPEKISFVSNSLTYDESRMYFLKKLSKTISLKNGYRTARITYYGLSQNMEELKPYFNCTAYDGNNSVYVVDSEGLKMFSSSTGGSDNELIKGFNIYHVLNNMEYLHGSSFDNTKKELETHNIAYSNAILNSQEIYYVLYRMDSAAWNLVFLIPSKYVAINTVKLVNITIRIVLLFAGVLVFVSVILIAFLMRNQQKLELEAEKKNNETLEAINLELKHAVSTAEYASKLAKAASEAKSNFLANMSHDIRTPMNAIVGITGLMEHEKGISDKMHSYIEKVQLSSRHLLGLINDILDMSKIESSEVTLNTESVSLAEQIGQIDTIIRAQANEHHQNFHIYINNIVHEYIIGDGVRLRQVILNLLSNAVKYTPNGGDITLDFSEVFCESPNYAKFICTVTDNGYGMSKQFLGRIFEPFTRAENSVTNKVQGTGLGMAITKNIVDLMGGKISVTSEVGRGSQFEVTLAFQIDKKMSYNLDIKHVLLVATDNRLITNMKVAMAEASIELYCVSTKEEATGWLTQENVDVILLSDGIQNKDLKETVNLLREVSSNEVLIFAVDYVPNEQVREELLRSGADGVVDRPFFLSNLEVAIHRKKTQTNAESENQSILQGMRFLCAEDNELNAEILTEILEMYEAECIIYSNGVEIVQAFKDVKPGEYDAILMDIQMPGMNGLEATKLIRNGENPLGKTIPIIAMTANAFSEDVKHCIAAGMDAHVAKPLDIDVLEKTLRGIVENTKY